MSRKLRAVPYVWDRDTNPVDGIALMLGPFVKAFVPLDRVLEISDRMVDLYKQREEVEEWDSHKNRGRSD